MAETTTQSVQPAGLGNEPVPAAPPRDLPSDVRAFCEEHGLLPALELTVALAKEHFKVAGEPTFRLGREPEDGSQ